MTSTLKDKKVLVVGRGSGIARAITEAARAAGATVTTAGRHPEKLAEAYERDPGVSSESVDLTDDDSITALAGRVGAVDHLVSTADTLTRSLAVELAPIRVNAISPGVIDTGAWDALGEDGKARLFAEKSERNPARRIGAPDYIADAAILALTNAFMTGVTLHVDGGERLT